MMKNTEWVKARPVKDFEFLIETGRFLPPTKNATRSLNAFAIFLLSMYYIVEMCICVYKTYGKMT